MWKKSIRYKMAVCYLVPHYDSSLRLLMLPGQAQYLLAWMTNTAPIQLCASLNSLNTSMLCLTTFLPFTFSLYSLFSPSLFQSIE